MILYFYIKDEPSAVWGGGTIGLVIGLILWFTTGEPEKILWSILIGAGIGLFFELVSKFAKN